MSIECADLAYIVIQNSIELQSHNRIEETEADVWMKKFYILLQI
jgi:hypothetical protein